VSELSGSADSLSNGPESPFVVEAVDAVLTGDVTRARASLIAAADAASWEAVAHRLDVVGRALALDAGLSSDDDDEIVLLPDLDTSSWVAGSAADAAVLLSRWSNADTADELSTDLVWPSLAVVAWLVDRAGYPAQVVV
jgi:hypothetical protein